MVSVQRRLNSTGRIRLTRESVHVELEQPADTVSFPWISARIDLKEFDFPGTLRSHLKLTTVARQCAFLAEP